MSKPKEERVSEERLNQIAAGIAASALEVCDVATELWNLRRQHRRLTEMERELAEAMDCGRTLANECERFRVEGNAEIERLEAERDALQSRLQSAESRLQAAEQRLLAELVGDARGEMADYREAATTDAALAAPTAEAVRGKGDNP